MSKELIESLRYLANRPPYSGAADIMLRAADALEANLRAGQEPVLYVNGEYLALALDNTDKEGRIASASTVKGHYCDTPLYTTPQPSAGQDDHAEQVLVMVPAGWKLVPVEPTPEMVRAAEEAHMPFGDMDIALRMAILSAPSAPATVQGDGWLPIETAPSDGRIALVYRPLARNSKDDPVAVKRLIGGNRHCWESTVPDGAAPTNPTDGACHVTHWMPIPAAPERQEGGKV